MFLGISPTQLLIMRRQVLKLLPSICNVRRKVISVDDAGLWDESSFTLLEHDESTDIQCRVDPIRTHRDATLFGQEILINDYIITLPYDVRLDVDDTVLYDDRVFQVKKTMQAHSWAVSCRAMITEVELT